MGIIVASVARSSFDGPARSTRDGGATYAWPAPSSSRKKADILKLIDRGDAQRRRGRADVAVAESDFSWSGSVELYEHLCADSADAPVADRRA